MEQVWNIDEQKLKTDFKKILFIFQYSLERKEIENQVFQMDSHIE